MTLHENLKELNELLSAKSKIEEAINAIGKLSNTDHIVRQLMAVNNQIKGINELKKRGIKLKSLSTRSIEYDLIDLN
tara:strand:+ start:5974 stop:6204 length:231 start_codon:yes stop_codon:yes gene_type:complete